jgi:DNA damage-binding protein 1
MYQGTLKILPIDGANIKEAFNTRFDMLTYIDIVFLYGSIPPTLCILYEDNRRGKHIATYIVDQHEKQLREGPWKFKNLEVGAHLLIPVPSPANGVIVVGERSICYINASGIVQSSVMDPVELISYCIVDPERLIYYLGDNDGGLYVLILKKSVVNGTTVVNSISIDYIGTVTIASRICHLDTNILYLGSSLGDSKLVRLRRPTIPKTRLGQAEDIEVLETFTNIGPILDMCLVQTEKRGQSRLITCSGLNQQGSLRVVSTGVGIQEQVTLFIHFISYDLFT